MSTCKCRILCIDADVYVYIGALIGFTNIGDINSHLDEYEIQLANQELRAPLATSMLLLMVRGLFTHLKFPYAQFPCTDLADRFYIEYILYKFEIILYSLTFLGDQLFDPLWEAVFHLENMGFKVLAVCCDGLAANRRLFSLHQPGSTPVYKVINPHAHDGEKHYLFFLSDPHHLIKTVRNC